MVVLALETVTKPGSAALVIDCVCDARCGDPARTHGERLPGDLLALLGDHGLTPRDVDRFAIIAGPGSFTGLRVGMAAVQGLALVAGRPVVPVPTLEAMAEGWRLKQASGPGPQAQGKPTPPSTVAERPGALGQGPGTFPVLVCLDGQRGDVFFGAWRLSVDEPVEAAPTLIDPSVGSSEELVTRVRRQPWRPSVVVGIGVDRHAAALAALRAPIEPLQVLLAEIAGSIAARRPELATAPHALRPVYIRRPDAVLARERAGLSGS